MRPIANAGTSEITLIKPSWQSGLYELTLGAEVFGQLDVSAWSGGSVGLAADGQWRFDRARGFTQRRVRVLDVVGNRNDEVELASFQRNGWSRGGGIELDNRTYRLAARGFWRTEWLWVENGVTLLTFSTQSSIGKSKGRLQFTTEGLQTPHGSFLALFGVHLALLTARETATAGGAAAAGGAVAASG